MTEKTKFNDHKLMENFLNNVIEEVGSEDYYDLKALEYEIEEHNGVKFKVVTSHGGEGQGDSCGFILKVTEGEQSALVRIEGYYNSYDGSNYEDATVEIVEPRQVEVTQYFKVKF